MVHKTKPEASKPVHNNLLVMSSILLAIILFYAWLSSSSHNDQGGRTTYYYTYLSQAFVQGNLHLSYKPDPQLLAMENPFDLTARNELEKRGVLTPVDFSLYKGKFYLYWGPVPALLPAIIQIVSHKPQLIADFFSLLYLGWGYF